MKILTFTTLYPNRDNPDFGIFVKNRMKAVSHLPGVEVKVVAPVPWFPPLRIFHKWYTFSQIPRHEVIDGIEVYHPRYLVTPKVGMTCYGFWMFLGALGCIRGLRRSYDFDLIDAHFVYPDGLAALLSARVFKKPVVISARGTDVVLYRTLPLVKHLLRATLKRADRLVAVSRSLGELMVEEGARREALSVIPNGIDPGRFTLSDQKAARQKLGLAETDRILVTVGALVELKGMHLLLEALRLLNEQGRGGFRTFIIGKGGMRPLLERKIVEYGLEEQVTLLGHVANENLAAWYNAADLFFLGSSREGWPNVVCEAQACGLPVVATPVNGIPEILDSEDLGIMVERTPADFARGIEQALAQTWDRRHIADRGRERTWEKVAGEIHALLLKVVAHDEN
jgi:glycosyltransferase involved in cell wall biosynthesis